MTDNMMMQISFLPQDVDLIRNFLSSKNYSNVINSNEVLNFINIDKSKIKSNSELCLEISELIINMIKEKDLRDYIWKTYTNTSDDEKESIYIEAIMLFEKKQDFIKNTIYNKVENFIVENNGLNLEGFVKFRMKDFSSYISIISDIALEENLIKRDKKEFLDSIKYFIDIQEPKMDLLRISITRDGNFILSDERGEEIKNINNKEIIDLAVEENLNDEDILISAIMTLCPKRVEVLDNLNNQKSKDAIEVLNLLFEGKVKVIYTS